MLGVGLSASLLGQKVATLTELQKPTIISVGEKYLYVNEGTTVFVYSRKDYKLVKKFGKAGEGPQEFMAFSFVIPQKENLLINSLGKISYFSHEGEFIREIRAKGGRSNFLFWPVGEGYVGRSSATKDNFAYDVVNLYDKELKKTKEVYRIKSDNQARTTRQILFPPRQVQYQTKDNKIYVSGKAGFIIEVLNPKGDPLFTIEEKNYKPRKFTSEDEKTYMEWLKVRTKSQFPIVKQMIKFQSHYPEIVNLLIDTNYLYAITWKFKGNQFETYVYDMNGKFVKKFFFTFAMQDLLTPYPIGINNGLIYQLIENDDEEWELFITNVSN